MKKISIALVVLGLFFSLSLPVVFADNNLGNFSENLEAGRTLSVGLSPSPSGNWYVASNSNPQALTASIEGQFLVIRGLAAGSSTVAACSEKSGLNCLSVSVAVSGVLGIYTAAHPTGSWINQGKTVFYVTDSGLIPITTWKIFLSNGGNEGFIQPINDADLSLPLLSFMVLNDLRVQ